MYLQIRCSNCGHRSRKYGYDRYPMINPADEIVKAGWNSYGTAFYCRRCAETWEQRNGSNKPLWGSTHTRIIILEKMVLNLKDELAYFTRGGSAE